LISLYFLRINVIEDKKFNCVAFKQQLWNLAKMYNFLIKLVIFSVILTGCIKNEIDPATGKKKIYEPNVEKRARAAAGEGVIIGGSSKVEYEFSNANPIWRATLSILEDIPIVTANYAGGLIATDWYSASNSTESVKIQIVFNDNKLSVSSFDVKGFKKICDEKLKCRITNTNKEFNRTIKSKILEKTKTIYQQDSLRKKK